MTRCVAAGDERQTSAVTPAIYVRRVSDVLVLGPGRRRGCRRGTAATTWYERGVALEAGDPAAAEAAYRRAVAGLPSLADAHNNLGRLLHERGALAEAEAHYRLALCAAAVEPGPAEARATYWFNLGVAVEDGGRWAEAIAAYREALAASDDLADAHFNLARLLGLRARQLEAAPAGPGGRAPGAAAPLVREATRHLAAYRALRPAARRVR